jgi:hypothetical protein
MLNLAVRKETARLKRSINPLKYDDHSTNFHETCERSMPVPNFIKIGIEMRKEEQKII